ncbi:TIGR00282 family metallophosphoesterase [bacterium]|nr:TIGR00282 family metallophosphoesterase [bacterium]MBU1652433.1 TIGR00282 family metallophosphoesterase [bacterium]MBU1880773.1 TIGR00282 family metallophosphoesterase [bacterium]
MNVLFIADIVGKPGLDVTALLLPSLLKKHNVEFCIANGENAAAGKSITSKEFSAFRQLGIDAVTSGNHIWDLRQGRELLVEEANLLRPLNYPPESPGRGSGTFLSNHQITVGVLNLQGRTFMYPIDCPFREGKKEAENLRHKTPIIIVDFHAEATAEKQALAWHLDGKVSAVIGTHTHVQTADERILPKGTAYITDAGMTGPMDSVIGLDSKIALKRFIQGIPHRYQMAKDNLRLNAVLLTIDVETGQSTDIQRLNLP